MVMLVTCAPALVAGLRAHRHALWRDGFGGAGLAHTHTNTHDVDMQLHIWRNRIKNIMYSGTSGILAWFVCRGLFAALGLGFIRRTVVEQGSNEKFVEACTKHSRRLSVFCWVVDKIISNLGGAMMAGVPSRQLELGMHREDNFQTIFRRILKTNLVIDNYFYYGYIAGEYSEACCPQYLKREQFNKLRAALKEDRLTLFEGTLVDVCKKLPQNKYTVASLLDHMDWMPPFMINEEMHWLQRQMCPKRQLFFKRSQYSDLIQ